MIELQWIEFPLPDEYHPDRKLLPNEMRRVLQYRQQIASRISDSLIWTEWMIVPVIKEK